LKGEPESELRECGGKKGNKTKTGGWYSRGKISIWPVEGKEENGGKGICSRSSIRKNPRTFKKELGKKRSLRKKKA